MNDNINGLIVWLGKLINGAVSVSKEQNFTDAEKAQAIENLGSVELEITYDDDSTGTLTVAGKLVND